MLEDPILDWGDNVIGRSKSIGTPYLNDVGEEVVDVIVELRDPIIKRLKLNIEKECVDREGKHKPNTRWFMRTYNKDYVRPPQFFMFPESGRNTVKIRIICGFNGESTDLTRLNEELYAKIKGLERGKTARARQVLGLQREVDRLRYDIEDLMKWIKKVSPTKIVQQEGGEEFGTEKQHG